MKNNWQTKTLEEVCIKVTDGVHKTPNYTKDGVRFISIKNILPFSPVNFNNYVRFVSEKDHAEFSRKAKVEKDDILFPRIGTLGFAKRVDFDEPVSIFVGLGLAKPNGKIIDPKYLEYWMNSPFVDSYSHEKAVGAGRLTLALEDSRVLPVSFPDLNQQRKIVKKLDEVFEKIEKAKENTEKNLQNSQEFFQSYLENVFLNPGKNWKKKKLDDIGKVSMCKRIFKKQTSDSGDIPFYKIGTFGKKANAFISNKIYSEYINKFSFPKKGDILLSASGTIGRRVKYDGEPAYFQDSNIVWIDNDEEQVLNNFLYHFYGACKWNSTKGATISRLYNDNLKQIEIAFPKSLSEQKEIVKKLDELTIQTRKLAENYRKKLEDLEELKKSILNQAFSGNL